MEAIILRGAASSMTEKQFFEQEIQRWKASKGRKAQITGLEYYQGRHDILARQRTVIGQDGNLQSVSNLPNNHIVDNQYAKMVEQKTNYLLGKPFNVQSDNEAYARILQAVFNRRFHKTIKHVGKSALNCGIGWLYVYYDAEGELSFKRLNATECLPFWADEDHTKLDCLVRVYPVEVYEGATLKTIEKVEIYGLEGVRRYELQHGALVEDVQNPSGAYIVIAREDKQEEFKWGRIPIVAFKYNEGEIPLICKVKCLQDAINLMLSDFMNNMQEDARNTILIIKNYDGENLADFRRNLSAYGAIKVKTVDGANGGVETLQVEVNNENYKVVLEYLKKALIENAMGFDAKDERISGTAPNQMNIQSMYSDIELDTNGMETEWKSAFEDLLFFINAHFEAHGAGKFSEEDIEIIFNRDMLMNEGEIITNIRNSVGILSTETLVAQHPWVDDPEKELDRLKKEKEDAVEAYTKAFPPQAKGEAQGAEGETE